jgi:hypothetical protein
MTKFFKDKPDDFGLLCIKGECAKLCLSSKGSHQFENCADDVNSAIDLNWRSITRSTAKEEVATNATSSVRGTEVQGIRVHIDYHVGSAILHFCIGMSGHVVEELITWLRMSSVGAACWLAIAGSAMRIVGLTAHA